MVVVYSKPNCVQCEMTKKFLDKAGIEYSVEDLLSEENAAQLAYFQAEGYLAAPIVVTDTKTWSGYQPTNLEEISK